MTPGKPVPLDKWSRKEYHDFFQIFATPRYGITLEVDVTETRRWTKANKESFFLAGVFAVLKAVARVPQFRQRYRGDAVIEHERVDPSFTVLNKEKNFVVCDADFVEPYSEFASAAAEELEARKSSKALWHREEKGDARIYFSVVPGLTFTAVEQPMPKDTRDAVPRLVFGGIRPAGDRLVMPVNVQVHHVFVDGYHLGMFHKALSRLLDDPETTFGGRP